MLIAPGVLTSRCCRVQVNWFCRKISGPSDPGWHLAPEPQLLKNPLCHKPNASDSYLFIHSVVRPFLVFYLLGSALGRCSWFCLSACLSYFVSRHACWCMALGVKWLSHDCKRVGGLFLMEACLLNPVGYPTSPAGVEGSWGRGGREA